MRPCCTRFTPFPGCRRDFFSQPPKCGLRSTARKTLLDEKRIADGDGFLSTYSLYLCAHSTAEQSDALATRERLPDVRPARLSGAVTAAKCCVRGVNNSAQTKVLRRLVQSIMECINRIRVSHNSLQLCRLQQFKQQSKEQAQVAFSVTRPLPFPDTCIKGAADFFDRVRYSTLSAGRRTVSDVNSVADASTVLS